MTQNRRIAINVIATYGRSLFAMACGLFSSRWALMSLGQIDYGLYGVIGGLTVFMCFLNGLMSSAISRFYAFSVGEAKKIGNEVAGIDNSRRWFNVSFSIHTVLPTLLVAIGYPIGVWLIEHFLTVPANRINSCIWVWRFTCIAAWVGMGNTPFMAMYKAKQEIAELTLYGMMTTIANVAVLYYMVGHPGEWLATYAFWMCVINVVPQVLIIIRATMIYPECKIVPQYFWDKERLGQLLVFAGARAFAVLSQMFSLQGVAIVINKWLGAARNATVTIGNTIANHSSSLAGAFSGALCPAIMNAVGEGRDEYARELTYRACLFSTVSFLLFALPLSVELDGVIKLWLKNPPDKVVPLSFLLLFGFSLERMTDGHWMLILAYGKIVRFQVVDSIANFAAVFFVVAMLYCGMDVESVGWGVVGSKIVGMVIKLKYAQRLCGLSVRVWARKIACPMVGVSVLTLGVGGSVVVFLPFSFSRIIISSVLVELVFVIAAWYLILQPDDRALVCKRLCDFGLRLRTLITGVK